MPTTTSTHLDWFSPQNEEAFGPLLKEARELVDQDVLDLVGLLDLDADAHGVDGRLDEDALVLVAGDGEGRQQYLGAGAGLDFRDVVPLGGLRGKVGQAQRGGQTASHRRQVRLERLRL